MYYSSAAAAAEAGLRPCLRCRPEAAPGSPAWNGTSATVSRALLLIRQGALNDGTIEDIAFKLGVSSRHLRRLFHIHLGASPKSIGITQKILFAKKLLSESDLSITEIAYAAGFGSIRRFNAAFNKIYGVPPSSIRRRNERSESLREGRFRCTLTLSYRPPFDWQSMLGFFEARAIPGVEFVANGVYHRTIRIDENSGMISLAAAPKESSLLLTVALSDSRELMSIVDRVRRMFDLDANIAAINEVLSADPLLEKLVSKHPGLRLPGSWDPFETAVRAVVGQQVSVKGARTILGRIVAKTGQKAEFPDHQQLEYFFPTAQELSTCSLKDIGMPERRGQTILALAREVDRASLSFVVKRNISEFIKQLTRIPGIGDWTAQYIAMRAMGEPDAFPAGDLGIVRALRQEDERLSLGQILERARKWRPWRAYAAVHLWQA